MEPLIPLGEHHNPRGDLQPFLFLRIHSNAMKTTIDTSLNALKTETNRWSGTQYFEGPRVQLGTSSTSIIDNKGSTSYEILPVTATDLTSSIIFDNQLVNKKYVDNMTGKANTWTNTQTFNDISVNNGFLSDASGFTFKRVPKLDVSLSPTDSSHLVSKSYVDALVPKSANTDRIIFGQQAIEYQLSNGNWVIEAPYLGTSITSNTNGTYYDFYIKFPAQSTYMDGSTSRTVNILQNNATFDFYYWYYQPSSITGSISTNVNKATYSTQILDNAINNTVGIFGLQYIKATFNVTIRKGTVLAHTPDQTTNIWTNNTLIANSQSRIQFGSSYNTNNIVMQFYPIQFTYINDQCIKVTVGYPNQANNPTKAYWIANLGFQASLRGSMPCNISTFQQGVINAVPVATSTNNSGGAWLSATA